MVKDSVEIMEQGACSGMAAVPIHYYDVDRMQEKTIESCQGDLTVICNVLADYADMLCLHPSFCMQESRSHICCWDR